MDLFDDSIFNFKYQKYKIHVKRWESNFMEKHGRKPSKSDIKSADTTIREAYKIYWKLKSKAVDEKLTQISSNNILKKNTLPANQVQAETTESLGLNSLNLETSYSNNDLSKMELCPLTFKVFGNVYGAWSEELNIEKKSVNNCETMFNEKSSFKLSKNMLQSFTFSKKNPVKSFQISKDQKCRNKLSLPVNDVHKNNVHYNIINNHALEHSCNKKYKIMFSDQELFHQSANTIQQLIEKPKININNKQLTQNFNSVDAIDNSLNSDTVKLDLSIKYDSEYNHKVRDNTLAIKINHYNEFSEDEDYIYNSDYKDRKYKRTPNFNNTVNDREQPLKKCCISHNKNLPYGFLSNNPSSSVSANIKMEFCDKVTKKLNNQTIVCSENSFEFQCGEQNWLEKKNYFSENKYQEDKQINNDKKNFNQIITSSLQSSNLILPLRLNSICSANVSNFSNNLPGSSDLQTSSHFSIKKHLTNKEQLEHKMSTGNLNENFIRINLKKKKFVRGKRTFSLSSFKKNQWKQKKKNSNHRSLDFADIDKGNKIVCLKCKKTGHSGKNCIDISSNLERAIPMQELCKHEVSSLYTSALSSEGSCNTNSISSSIKNNNLFKEKACDNTDRKLLALQIKEVKPVYESRLNMSIEDTPIELQLALKRFGHKQFRLGQEQAILRILSGKSTLLTLATGSGKSLCYQLPAYIYAKRSTCLSLVISPLISLMDDQVSKIPDFLSAACLHTNQSIQERAKVLENLQENKIDILFVSPEAIVAQEQSNIFGGSLFKFPPIAFVCIDEVHCISHWSHNFRPAFLNVCKVLKENFGVKRILGLTATATKSTIMNIINILGIEDGMEGVIAQQPLPSNLKCTISRDLHREEALLILLHSQEFMEFKSIIVYCTRRKDCERIAGIIRLSLGQVGSSSYLKEKNLKLSTIAEAYHAGLSVHRRKVVQQAFIKSEIRVIVATLAFGMGIDKSNIRAVVHFNMPASFENYVQEIGRAGRDGLPAYCHLFLNAEENTDEHELRRHINANGLDRHIIRRLLEKIFSCCNCSSAIKCDPHLRCLGHEVAFSIDETIKTLDISEEMISTLLCYLELHPKQFIKLLPPSYINATISSENGSNFLKLAAQSSPALAMAMNLFKKSGSDMSTITFPVIYIASAIGCDSNTVKSQLKDLEWTFVNGKRSKTHLSVKFDTLGFRVRTAGDFTCDELDEALEYLFERCNMQANLSLQQLQLISALMREFSFDTVKESLRLSEIASLRSEKIKNRIYKYFKDSDVLSEKVTPLREVKLKNEAEVVNDIRRLILSYKDVNFTGRIVARIFHGIQSPNYPTVTWCKCRFWRAHISIDFNILSKLAEQEILKIK